MGAARARAAPSGTPSIAETSLGSSVRHAADGAATAGIDQPHCPRRCSDATDASQSPTSARAATAGAARDNLRGVRRGRPDAATSLPPTTATAAAAGRQEQNHGLRRRSTERRSSGGRRASSRPTAFGATARRRSCPAAERLVDARAKRDSITDASARRARPPSATSGGRAPPERSRWRSRSSTRSSRSRSRVERADRSFVPVRRPLRSCRQGRRWATDGSRVFASRAGLVGSKETRCVGVLRRSRARAVDDDEARTRARNRRRARPQLISALEHRLAATATRPRMLAATAARRVGRSGSFLSAQRIAAVDEVAGAAVVARAVVSSVRRRSARAAVAARGASSSAMDVSQRGCRRVGLATRGAARATLTLPDELRGGSARRAGRHVEFARRTALLVARRGARRDGPQHGGVGVRPSRRGRGRGRGRAARCAARRGGRRGVGGG